MCKFCEMYFEFFFCFFYHPLDYLPLLYLLSVKYIQLLIQSNIQSSTMEHTMVDNNLSAYELARLQRIDENKEYVSSLLSFFFLTKRIYICRSLDINIFVILYIYNEYIVQHLTSDFFFVYLFPEK